MTPGQIWVMRHLVALMLLVAACSGSSGTTDPSLPPSTAAPTTTTSPPGATVTAPPATTTTTVPPRPELSKPQVVYFLMDAAVGAPRLVPVWRDATAPQGVRGAIEALLAGPTPVERLGVPALSTAIPPDADLLGVTVVNGLATVDLTDAFLTGGEAPVDRLAQVVYTATRFEEVESVTFRIAGEPFTGLPGGAGRSAFRDLQGAVFVDEPPYGGTAPQPGRLRGEARIAAGSFRVAVTDSEGVVVADFAVESEGTEWAPFDVPLRYFVDVDQPGELRVATADGVVDVVYPLQLELPDAATCAAAGFSPEPVVQDLPEAVDTTRRAIAAAAVACDFDALAALGGPEFTFSFGGGSSAAEFWRDAERAGIPVTRLIVQILNTPPVLDSDFVVPTYLWPAAFRAAPTPEDFDLLVGILAPDDLALYREFNEYLDLRIGISAEGSWDFAVSGD